MNNQNYIRKAIVLSDGWRIIRASKEVYVQSPFTGLSKIEQLHQGEKDALAAQLRKQAQSDPHIVFKISVVDSASYVEMIIYNPNGDEEAKPLRFVANETDEAIAFINVIVDSKVLETENKNNEIRSL